MKKLIIVLLFATAGATYAQKIDTIGITCKDRPIASKEDFKILFQNQLQGQRRENFYSMPGHMDSLDVYYQRYLNDIQSRYEEFHTKWTIKKEYPNWTKINGNIIDYYDIIIFSKYADKPHLDSIIDIGKHSYEKIIAKKKSNKHRQMIVFLSELIGLERTYVMLGQEATTGFENQIFFFEHTKKYYDKYIKTKENPIEWKDDKIFKNKIFLTIGHNPHRNSNIRVIPLSELRKKNIAVIEDDRIGEEKTERLKQIYGGIENMYKEWIIISSKRLGLILDEVVIDYYFGDISQIYSSENGWINLEDWRTIKGASTAE